MAPTTTTTPTMVQRGAALLENLLDVLEREWTPQQTDAAAVREQLRRHGVRSVPGVVFSTDAGAAVEVRGLAIGAKLFVHFVASEAATRVDFLLSEYTKACSDGDAPVEPRTHARVGPWLVNTELLQWRLARAVFPLFRASASQRALVATAAGAELGRLPEPLLLRIAPFLTGKEFCGMSLANTFLHGYAESQAIWQQYLTADFPATAADPSGTAKTRYVACSKRAARRAAAIRNVFESLPGPPLHDPFARPRPFILPQVPRPPSDLPPHPSLILDFT